MAERVILIVKAANQSSLDKRIEFDLNSSVHCLKEEISKTHPIKPSVQEQRLIYSGHLLQDSLLLKAVLRYPSENNEYIIHLVCSSPKQGVNTKNNAQESPLASVPSQSSPVVETNENVTRHEASSESSEGDGVRRRYVANDQSPSGVIQQQDIDATTTYPYFSQFSFPLPNSANPIQQMAAMQQMYSQYMTSYMQYMQSVNIDGGRIQHDVTQLTQTQALQGSSNINESSGGNAELQNQNGGANANEEDAQRNAQMRVNPQAAPGEDEEDGMARDWLDYIYFGSRLVVLLSIVYFYSTFSRFMFVACTTILIYMYQGGWFRFLGLEDRPPQAAPEHRPPADIQDEDNPGQQPNTPPQPGPQNSAPPQPRPEEEVIESGSVETLEEEREEAASNSETAETRTSTSEPIMEALPPQPSFLALSWTFLTTFFTSLIPEQHQIV